MKALKKIFYIVNILWKTSKQAFIVRIIYSLLTAIVTPLTILLTKFLIDSLTVEVLFSDIILIIIGYSAIAFVPQMFLSYLSNLFNPVINMKFEQGLNNMVMKKSRMLDYSCFDDSEFFDKYTRAFFEADRRATQTFNQIMMFISNLLSLFALGSILVALDPLLIVFSIISITIGFIADLLVNKDNFECYNKSTKFKRILSYCKRIVYQPQYAKDMKMNIGLLNIMLSNYNTAVEEIQNNTKKYGKIMFLKRSVQALAHQCIEAVSMIYLSWGIISQRYALGSFVALLNTSQQLTSTLASLLQSLSGFHESCLYIDNLTEMTEYIPIVENRKGVELSGTSLAVCMDNVTFKYRNSTDLVLKNISLNIESGQHIAIVGLNGSGKSTLVKLLCGLYKPLNGSIKYNSVDVDQISTKSLRASISTVFQDFNTYGISLAENVSKEKEFDTNLVVESLEKVGLNKKAQALESGIDTILSTEFDGGIELSGGESQKIEIASAFYKQSKMLIFDEPTSRLDALAEKEIIESINKTFCDQTTILISHRLANVIACDKIYYMEAGQIIECGTHEELMIADGKYAKLFISQAQEYIPKGNGAVN